MSRREDIMKLLMEKDISFSFRDLDLIERFYEGDEITEGKELDVAMEKLKEYNAKIENTTNKYSEEVMEFLRQRKDLDKYDLSEDEDLNTTSPREAFAEVMGWNGLGGYEDTIKRWIKDIYGVDLDKDQEN